MPESYKGADGQTIRAYFPFDLLLAGPDEALASTLKHAGFTIQQTSDTSAYEVHSPTLYILADPEEIVIGPLAIPGRPGCGHCAQQRLRAAAIANQPADKTRIAADCVQRLLRDIDSSRLIDHIRIGDSLHRFLPLPQCPVCGGARGEPEPQPLSGDDSIEHVLAALAGYVDPRTGVISRVTIEDQFPIVVTAGPPHIFEDGGSIRQLPIGWGKGTTLSGAMLSAVGEAVERYSASLPDLSRFHWVRMEELDGDILDPREFALYTDEQYERDGFSYVRFDPNVAHPWVRGHWLGSERPVWVHAVFAYLSLRVHKQHMICQGTSNGLAASTDPKDAALRATMELVERDAFLATWLTGRPARRIELPNEPELASVVTFVESLGATVKLYQLDTGAFGRTVLCLALGDGIEYPGVTLGLGSALDLESAVRQAVLELGQTGPYLRRMMQSDAIAVPETARAVRTMLDHAAYYFPAERARAFDRMRRGDAVCSSPITSDIRVAIVDVTSPDIAMGPFRVMRAVSPDLQDISYGYGMDRAVVARIRRMGLAAGVPEVHPIW